MILSNTIRWSVAVRAAAGLALGAALLPASAEEAAPLTLQLKPGQKYRQTLSLRQAQSPVAVSPGAPDRTVTATYDITASDRVEAGPAGSPLLRITYDRTRLETKSAQKSLQFDTADGKLPADPEGRTLCEAIGQTVGKTLVLTLDARGRVTDVQAPPEIPADLAAGSQLITNPLAGIPGLLPDKPVKTGDRWTAESPFDMPVPRGKVGLILKVDSEWKSVEGTGEARTAVIVSEILLKERAPAAGAPPAAPWAVGGSGTITSRFHLARGIVCKTEGVIAMAIRPEPESSAPTLRKILVRQEIAITVEPVP
jgi:hypothetical protein